MSRRVVNAFLTAGCLALAACQATGEPPVAEWSVEPSNALPEHARAGGGALNRSAALTNARGSNAPIIVPGSGRFVGPGRQAGPEAPEGEENVTLNLANLPIAQAVKVVLGDIMGVNYVIDPRLDGKVTVHTTRPVSKAAAMELFQSALRVVGGAVVDAGGVYKVVPLDQAATAGGAVSTSTEDPSQTAAGESTRVVQLHYVAPAEMRRLLEPMTIQGGVIQADEARHTITLKGTPQDLASLQDIIAMFDIDTMRGMSFALVPVKSGDPDSIVEDLRKVFGTDEKDGPMRGMVRFVSNKRLASVLVISAQPAYLERARSWIQRLDARAQGTEKQFFTYRVQNRPAKEMLAVLSSMFGADGKSGSNTAPRFGQSSASSSASSSGEEGGLGSSNSAPSSPLGALSSSGSNGGGIGGQAGGGQIGGGGLGSSTTGGGGAGGFGGQPSGPGGAPGFFQAGLGNGSNDQQSKGPGTVSLGDDGRYKVGVDEAKNSLVVMATAEDYKKILHVIEALDVQPNQVFIEATIAEVALNDDLHFGVSWFLQKGRHAAGFGGLGPVSNTGVGVNTFLGNNNIAGNNLIGVPLQSVFPGFSYAFTLGSAVVTINALNALTDVDILSTPSLTVLDNRQAMLQVGQQIPVNTLQSVSAIGNTFNSQSYLNTGVILAITPHISESGRLMLDIEQEVSNPVPGTGLAGNNPTIDQRKVKTQVAVADGESLLLGGLVQDQRSKDSNQIPVIGDIPVVGAAFKDKQDQISKKELIIMITPHVIRTMSEARAIAEEYKRKLLYVSTKAIARPHDIEQSTRRTLLDDTSVSPWIVDKVTR